MKALFLTIIVIFLLVNKAFGQNLVPNGDFEEGPVGSSEAWTLVFDNTCSSLNLREGPANWVVLNNTPDRLLYNDIYCNFDNTPSFSGNYYVHFAWQEAGKATLTEPLEIDSLYRLSFYLSLNTNNASSFEPNRLFFKFNNDTIFSNYVESNNWIHFDTIFKSNSNSPIIEIWGSEFTQSGIYLDNISLTKINSANLFENINSKFNVYPNPSNGIVKIDGNQNYVDEIEIFNVLNQKIRLLSINEFDNYFNLMDLDNGIYQLIFIKSFEIIGINKIIIIK